MPERKRCPKCQSEIPVGAPEGLCPSCLLQAGLQPNTREAEPKTAAYTPTGAGFVPPTPEELQSSFPQLEILELLGKGGMGAVYKARQPGLDRLVAVKILPPEVSQDPAFAERFTREARALAMLNHPNIVGIYDSGKAGGYYYFVMEYLDGVNLRQAMRAGELKSAEALKIVPQICEALQFAHDEGIVHRDIKPENILLDKKGRVKIADFGLAKLLGKTAPDIALTGTQQVMGTMHYMAPEQLEGSRDVDHRADIYSLGVTFYEMLTGELPIGRFAAPSKIVQIDVRLDEVVLRSLEKEPEQRYQHASEIKTEVEAIGAARPPAPPVAAPAVDGALEQTIVDLLPEDRVDAVRKYRETTGAALADAVRAVRAIAVKHGLEHMPFWTPHFLLVCAGPAVGWIACGIILAILQVAPTMVLLVCVGGVIGTFGWVQYHLKKRRQQMRWIVEGFDEVVLRSLEKSPEQRYQQASEIKTAAPPPSSAAPKTESPAPEPTAAPSQPTYLRKVMLPCAIVGGVYCLVMLANLGLSFLVPEGFSHVLLGEVGAFLLFGGGFLVAAVCLSLNGVWLIRVAAIGGYVRNVIIPFAVLCLFLVPAVFLFTIVSRSRNGAEYEWGDPRELAAMGAALAAVAFLLLNGVWLCRTYGFGFAWKYLPFAWTALCMVLFVMLWTPYESNRVSWSGYLDGGIWPYRETNDCAISLEPTVPTCKRIVIREKTELAFSGNPNAHKGSRQPDVHRTSRLTYDIELQPLNWDARHLIVDALNGMSWTADGGSGSILDAGALAEWMRSDGRGDRPVDEETRKAAITLQARAIVDIIQRASRDQYVFTYGGTREYPGGNFVSGAGVKISRLEDAANHHGKGADFRNLVFKHVLGWNAAESVKAEPVVPILYVGVPLMLAVWGVGLLLLLRYGRASKVKADAVVPSDAAKKPQSTGSEPTGPVAQTSNLPTSA
jgi:serine/threonine protein kinase